MRIKPYMRKEIFKAVTCLVMVAAVTAGTTGCGSSKSGEKGTDSSDNAPVKAEKGSGSKNDGPVEAAGKGNNNYDTPLVIGEDHLSKKINIFGKLKDGDLMAVRATQASLVTFDREDMPVEHAAKGEKRDFSGKTYTYRGLADVSINYSDGTTSYKFTLLKNVHFSDGALLTADDLVFSLNAFNDKSCRGSFSLKDARITGIKKLGKYKVKVTTKGYDKKDIHRLDIPVLPLHYYGKKSLYNYKKEKYGFEKGEVEELVKKNDRLIGAGPYTFIKNEDKTAYFEANGEYYKGCPQIAFLQVKKMQTKKKNSYGRVLDLVNGVYDVEYFEDGSDITQKIKDVNANKDVNGDRIYTRYIDGSTYETIVINADKVNIDKRPDSDRSKNLRKALAVLFSFNKEEAVDKYYSYAARVIDYPYAGTSWVVPESSDKNYITPFTSDGDGESLYDDDMDADQRFKKAADYAMSLLKEAGYDVKDGKLSDAALKKAEDEGLPTEFDVELNFQQDKSGCLFEYLRDVSERAEKYGLKINVRYNNSKNIKKSIKKHKAEIWNQEFTTESDADMNKLFEGDYSFRNNIFGIADSNIDDLIEQSEDVTDYKEKADMYQEILNKVGEWASDVPMYQLRQCVLFNSSVIDTDSLAGNTDQYYDWFEDIEKIKIRG